MKFKIKPEIFKRFHGLNIGVVVAKQIDNHGESEEIMCLIREKEEVIRKNFNTEILSNHPKIQAWRKAYSSFRAKPKKYKSSIESLYETILRGTNLRSISKIVNIYNYISIKHMIPAGGDDKTKVEGDINLKFARGNEPFTALNSQETQTAKEGEVVYVDDREVLCRRWNWRECDKTKMTEDTKEAVLVVEGLPPVSEREIIEVEKDLCGLILKYCGGEVQTAVLNENIVEIEF